MITKKLLILASLSTLLVTTTVLEAKEGACVGENCMATAIHKTQSSRSFIPEKQKIEKNFQNNNDDSLIPIILDGELINVFSSYGLQDAKTFPLEDIILEQTDLPNSIYYCENHKIALFDKDVDIYECV